MKTIELDEAKRLVAEGQTLSKSERLRLQQQRLRELVAYARVHSPYFAKHYAGVPDDFKLTDLPITTKTTLMDNYDEWVTDRRLNRAMVEEYVNRDSSHDQSKLLGEYTALHTSGSTGNPLLMVRDDFRNKIHGQLISQRLLGGVDPEVLNFRKHKRASCIYLSNGASSYGALLRMRAANPGYEHHLLGVSVLDSISHIVEILNDYQPETMAGYPSVMVPLAVEQKKGNLHINLKHLATSSEMLSEKNYYLLRDAFGCPVANNYCMTEGGEIAMTHDCPHLHINDDWVIIEPVDKDGRVITNEEEWSEGILVTDLTNYVQPVIRYYVGDVVRIHPSTCDHCQLPVMEIKGRSYDACTLGGQTFSMIGPDSEAEVWPGVCRYQFVQTSENTLEVRATIEAGKDASEVLGGLCRRLEEVFVAQGCRDVTVTWSTEPFIPNKKGGKVPLLVKQF